MQLNIPATLIALIFLVSGVKGFTNVSGFKEFLSSLGFPFAGLMAIFALSLKVFGGYSIIADNKYSHDLIRLLIIFTAVAIVTAHNFIAKPGELNDALKNLAIIGGLMLLLKYGNSTNKTNYIKNLIPILPF